MAVQHVLIVEDQRDLARMIRSGLRALGHDFHILDVPSAEEALLIADRHHLDLVLIDVKLPGISGLELMQKLKQRQPGSKIVLLTGLTDPDTRRDVQEARADAYFFKPVELGQILGAVETLLKLEPSLAEQPAAAESPEVETEPSLSGRLANLRRDLRALATIILDERGQILVQAGDLPAMSGDTPLTPALMAVFSSAEKLSQALGVLPPEDMLKFSADKYDLYLAHLGQAHSLVVACPRYADARRGQEIFQALKTAVTDLRSILATLGVPILPEADLPVKHTPVPKEAPSPEAVEIDVEAVLLQASSQQLDPEEVDAFWEVEEKINTGSLSPDGLSFDQAQKLGLTPEE